ncbi:MAG: molybdopterin-synthase adenylyltransferase MoeB [Thiothrix sp.]|nr:MAG: molybdopterin-synthase adenylyltransferase MoeB [Thiothrix sp.]
MELGDEQLLRYSRQILLPQLDVQGQERLLQASVLIFGLGGLGSPVSLYLAAAGVGRLILVDPDTVDLSNLQRQIVHSEATVGILKVLSAQERLQAINSSIQIEIHPQAFAGRELVELVQTADLVIDCTDNLSTRLAINAACVEANKPLISAAAIRFEGQIAVFQAGPVSPCYQCFYGKVAGLPQTCTTNGVLGPVLGVLGSMQAIEAIKFLTQLGDSLLGRVLLFDALSMEWTAIRVPKRADCPICSKPGQAQ